MADRIMLVTGGSRGIGAAVARLAATRGYDVCVNYQSNAEAAAAVVADIEKSGQRGLAVQGDMAVEADVERLFETVDRELGTLTALIGNAGLTGHHSRFDEVPIETLRKVIDLNVTGLMMCCRAALRRMSTKHGGPGGGIVNLSSAVATIGAPGYFVWYAASKGAVDSLTKGLALEVAREGIRVNAVAPGIIDTEIHAASGLPDRLDTVADVVPMGYAAAPEAVAETILWLLSEGSGYITGETLRVAGGR